jgi:ribonuclease P protein component
MMLPKVNRLRSKRDFKRTLSGQRIASGPYFAIYALLSFKEATSSTYLANQCPRIGFVVSKKVHKRAVIRNRLKRQFREIFRHWLSHSPQSASLSNYKNLVVIVRTTCVGTEYKVLEKALSRALRIPQSVL